MKDIVIAMDTTPGRPADILDDLTEQQVRVVAGSLFPRPEGRVAHVTVSDEHEATVREVALRHGAIVLDARDVLVVDPAQHGGPAAVARAVADSGAIVYVSYFGDEGQIVLATSDMALARGALGLAEDGRVSPAADRSTT